MKLTWFILSFTLITTSKVQAVIHKRTEYFLDIELSKKDFLMTCSAGPKDDNSIVGFDLLDGDTYYSFYYRRVRTVKECNRLRKEYMDMLEKHNTVRIVANHPIEKLILDSERKEYPAPFSKAKKIISGPFIRLQAGDKCKAYFSEDCDLPKNYWGGVTPEK